MPSYSSTIRGSAELTVEPAADHCAVALRERKVLVGFDGFVDNAFPEKAELFGDRSLSAQANHTSQL
jgi:hypothetical protein